MIEPLLRSQLEPVARRRRQWRLSRDLAVWWAAMAALALGFVLLFRRSIGTPDWVFPAIGALALVGAVIVWARSRRWIPDFRQVARQIEQTHPDLHALLLTAVEQRPDASTGKFNFLQERVIQEAILKGTHGQWQDTISTPRLRGMQMVQLAAFLCLIAAFAALRIPTVGLASSGHRTAVNVTPGNASIERGSGLAVLARFDGPLPPEVTLVIRPDAQVERKVTLVKSLNDPVFGGTIPEITNALSYRVDFPGGASPDFKVEVFEYPRLERADAHLAYPTYTGIGEKDVLDTRRVSAVEGSTLDLSLQLNKPVASARLIAKDKTVIPLSAATNRANALLSQFGMKKSQIYELVLVDAAGRTNKVPTQIVVDVLTNRAPELKFASPRGDQRVSPLQEINFQAEVWDDFGLKDYGLTYTLAGGEPHTIAVGTSGASREKRQFSHLLELEELDAQPDQLLSYFIWADDTGPDGQVRRTASDMFYAEVRPFEEIFREGQSAPERESQEQSGQSGELTKLAELQKQIINATWRLQRDHRVGINAPLESTALDRTTSPAPVGPTYQKDVTVIEQSQAAALRQAAEKKDQSESARSKSLWDAVEKEMQKAADQLGKAGKSTEALPSAVASEQAAYQALLKLASREKQVVQGRGGKGSGSQQNQRQLEQLDLKQSENRYENQSQAAANKQNPEQREQQQILNRLKELSQRQQDLNERLKELQTALQEAKTQDEREEVQRRLKRLREEEQQMLADTDELLQRMERPENQSRLADARQQLEQTRNQIQRTSEMMEKEAVGQALSSGTRAQRQLQDLREDLRKRNSAQFAEEMREMRSEARDLAQKEDQIGEKLKVLADSPKKSLSDSEETKKLLEQMGQQKEKMTNLIGDMTRVSQDAEASEPLLAKQLYDTLRKASQGHADESLQKAGELLKLSFLNEAGQFEERARKEINQVKQGVEKAAESVLGDETEALRMARNELDDLARQVENELARAQDANSNKPGQNQRQGQSAGQEQSQNGQRGQPQPGAGQEPGQEKGETDVAQAQQGQGAQNSEGQPDESQETPPGAQPGGQGRGNRPGQPPANQEQLAQANANSPSQQPGQNQGEGTGSSGNPQGQGRNPEARAGRPRQRASLTGQPRENQPQPPGGRGNQNQPGGQGGGENGGEVRRDPITGEGYAEWSDRLRDVEEMLDLPDLRNEVAGVRERARAMRAEFKRHSKSPQWDLVRGQIAAPLAEVRNRINEELARRDSSDPLVPIDRDPVPQRFSELVRRYYEKLGSSEGAGAPLPRTN